MKPTLSTALLLLLLSPPLISGDEVSTASNGRARLIVRVEGLGSNQGKVALALFDDRDAFDRRQGAVRADFVPLRKKRGKWIVEDLQPGRYALVAYHDKNGNGELDRRKMFGIPSEPYGFSNDARGKFGPPPFDAALFEISGRSSTITIRLR